MDKPILKPQHIRAISIIIILGVALFLGLSIYAGWENMLHAFHKIGWVGLLVALSLTVGNLALRVLRWTLFMQTLHVRLSLIHSARIYLGGLALSATPGKSGEMIRSLYLRQHGVSYMQSIAMFIADRFSDLIIIVLFATAVIWTDPASRPIGIVLLATIVAIILAVHFQHWYKKFARWFSRKLRWRRVRYFLLKSIRILTHSKSLFNLRVFSLSLFLSMLAWTVEGVSLYIVTQRLDIEIALVTVLSIIAFSKLVGTISMIPAGMGSTEATLIALLMMQGVTEVNAIACALFLRLTTFWFVTTLGLIALPRSVRSNRSYYTV